jgi:hypothetical protein
MGIQMIANSRRFLRVALGAAALLAGPIVASCTPQYSAPQQVEASNPTVTYKYRSDQELVQANRNAAIFCNRYQAVPRTGNFSNDPDGSRVIVFECVQPAPTAAPMPAAPMPAAHPNLTYTYRTDQELLDASRAAQTYCMNNGSRQVLSNIVTNANGTRTVTFQCSPG